MTVLHRNYPSNPEQRFVFDQAPLLVYWEATRACDLACIHCRAEAVPARHPLELTTAEAGKLFEQIASFGGRRLPHLVITGGDPLQRHDLLPLIAHARRLGLDVSITPAGTGRLTGGVIEQFKEAGIVSLGLSLDGSDAKQHDSFRRVVGSYDWTTNAARAASSIGLPVQLNTMVTAQTLADLPQIYELAGDLKVARWALFFLISTGRGKNLLEITPEECERLLNWLWQIAAEAPFAIKTTEAHHFRRILFLKLRTRGLTEAEIVGMPLARGFGIRDGNGVIFVSHTGQVYPSGFLPLKAGNVHERSLVEIYRSSPLLRAIRDVDRLKGKCGRCEFRAICGGSRARAYAGSGDPLESDPLCPYQPRT